MTTLFGVYFALLITGAIVTETVFAWPGVGRLTYEAVIFRDYPLLQAVDLAEGDHRARRQPRRGHPLRLPGPAGPVRLTRWRGSSEPIDAGFAGAGSPQVVRRSPGPGGDLARGCRGSRSLIIVVLVARRRRWRRSSRPTRPPSSRCPTSCCRPPGRRAGARSTCSAPTLLGRDVLSRLIYGARVSLIVAAAALLAGGGVGLVGGHRVRLSRRTDGRRAHAGRRRHAHVPDDPHRAAARGEPGPGPAARWSIAITVLIWARFRPASSAARCSP